MKIVDKILTADFSSGKDRVTARGLWQFDRGVKLKVIGINVTDVNRVDFAPVIASEAVPVVVVPDGDGTFTVSIPGAATKSPYDVTAYIYVDTADYGYTVKAVNMPVILRQEVGKPGEEEKPDPFGEVVEKVSGYAKEAQDSAKAADESASKSEKIAEQVTALKEQVELSAKNANASEQAAGISEKNAAESERQARESAVIARSAADQAGKSATAAAESETAAAKLSQSAERSATNASGSAESASRSAETAKTAADAASKSGSATQQAVRSAAESASTATAAAQTATTAAGEAAASATSAARSAEEAGQKAAAAETSASNAAESAVAAGKSATAAGDSAGAAKTSETAAEEAAQTAQEQAERLTESAEQIEKNKAGVAALKEDLTSKADKTSLAQTDRKLDALWKLNQGISYKFEEDSEAAYQKEVPSGAKLASVKQIGGKTIVWNQLLNCDALKADLSRMYDVTNDDGIYTLIAKGIGNRAQQTIQVKQNHIYLMKAVTNEVDGNSVEFCPHSYGNAMANMAQCYNKGEGWKRIYQIIKAGYTGGLLFQFYLHASEYPATMQYKAGSFQVFDLTQMFGAGNEPSTVEAFEAMFPEDYYSYNEGELLSAGVNEIVEHGRNLIDARKVVSKTSDVNFENLGNGKIHVYGSTDTRSEIDPVYVDEKDFPPGQYRINVIGISGISVTFVKKNKATGEKTWCNDKFEITDNDTPLYWYVMAVKCTVDIVITPQITAGDTKLPTLVYHDPVSFAIPEAVRQLPGYGWSAGNIYNEIDFENKKYIQRVAAIDFGKLTFAQYDPTNHTKHTWYTKVSNMRPTSAKLTCAKYTQHSWISMDDKTFLQGIIQSHPSLNYIYISDDDYTNASDFSKAVSGVMLYYELAEPIITDISDIVGDTFQEPFEVEAGGTLTFQNSHGDDYRIPVSSTEEYLISLAEVAK